MLDKLNEYLKYENDLRTSNAVREPTMSYNDFANTYGKFKYQNTLDHWTPQKPDELEYSKEFNEKSNEIEDLLDLVDVGQKAIKDKAIKLKKAKRELVYLASAAIVLSICIWLDPYGLARFVGRTMVKLGNPDFQIVLALGVLIALRKDIVLAAISAAVLEIIITFSAVKEWRQSVGLNPSDGEVILFIGLPTLVGTFVLYLFFIER